jgi:hypothetical protein
MGMSAEKQRYGKMKIAHDVRLLLVPHGEMLMLHRGFDRTEIVRGR